MQARSCSTRLTGIYDYTGKVKGKAWKGKNVLQRSSSKDDDLMLLEDIDSDFLRKTNVKGLDFTGCYLVVADLPDLCRLVEMLPSCEVVILRGCNVKTARADNLQKLLLIPHLRFLDVSLTTLASAIRIDLYKCLEDHDFDKLIFIDNPEQLSRPGWRVLVHPELQPRVIKTHQAYFTSYPSKIRSRNVLEIPEWGSWGLVPPLLGPIYVKRNSMRTRSPGIQLRLLHYEVSLQEQCLQGSLMIKRICCYADEIGRQVQCLQSFERSKSKVVKFVNFIGREVQVPDDGELLESVWAEVGNGVALKGPASGEVHDR
eukprot:m.177803 g.177803  ORF g.177803 m.177803 type:complete len:315 (+) comp9976_c0_seq6:59-1003(+)